MFFRFDRKFNSTQLKRVFFEWKRLKGRFVEALEDPPAVISRPPSQKFSVGPFFSLNRRQPKYDTYNNAGRRKDSHHSEMKAEGEAVEDGEIETEEVIGDSITISIKLLSLIKSPVITKGTVATALAASLA